MPTAIHEDGSDYANVMKITRTREYVTDTNRGRPWTYPDWTVTGVDVNGEPTNPCTALGIARYGTLLSTERDEEAGKIIETYGFGTKNIHRMNP